VRRRRKIVQPVAYTPILRFDVCRPNMPGTPARGRQPSLARHWLELEITLSVFFSFLIKHCLWFRPSESNSHTYTTRRRTHINQNFSTKPCINKTPYLEKIAPHQQTETKNVSSLFSFKNFSWTSSGKSPNLTIESALNESPNEPNKRKQKIF
jgi:hypothetical protein